MSQYEREAVIRWELGGAVDCLRFHWPEYLMEAGEVGLYLFLTCVFASLLLYPASPIRRFVNTTIELRALMGLAVGATVLAIVISPWGKQSGGHFNPALTLAFYRLSKMSLADAVLYIVAQFAGAIAGMCVARYVLPETFRHRAIRYAVTAPGARGSAVAFIGELARYTPYFVGLLYAIFITMEAPLSGMSMNPARSFGPALHVSYWHAIWLYFTAPTLGMLIAAEIFLRARGGVPPFCAKLHHDNNKRCLFRHGPTPRSTEPI